MPDPLARGLPNTSGAPQPLPALGWGLFLGEAHPEQNPVMNSGSQLPLSSLTPVSLLSGANAPRWSWLALSWDAHLLDPKETLTHRKQLIHSTNSKRYLPSLWALRNPSAPLGSGKTPWEAHRRGQGIGVQGPLRMGESPACFTLAPFPHHPYPLTGLILGPGPYFVISTEAVSVKIQRDHLHLIKRSGN